MSLVAHWGCQDNVASTTVVAAVGSDATLVGGDNTSAISVSGPGGAYPLGLNLDGTADYLTTSATIDCDADWSLAGWLNITSGTTGDRTWWSNNNAGGVPFDLRFRGSPTSILDVCLGGFTNGTTALRDGPITGLVLGEWHHVTVTWDATSGGAGTAKIHVNSVQTASTALSAANTATQTLHIGRRDSGTPQYFRGAIADIRVYDELLSAAAMQTIMAEARPQPKRTMSFFRMGKQ